MTIIRRIFKFVFFLVFILIFPYLMLEGISAGLLATGIVENKYPLLFEKFPAQFRLSTRDLLLMFRPMYKFSEQLGHFYEVDFDPAMGFRNDSLSVDWYGGDPKAPAGKFVIVALGGSTTFGDNWPKYLSKYAKEENVEQDLLVLNAGHPGFMTFQQKIYFSSWILPKLEKENIKPNLVITVDGVNDVHFRVESYTEYKKNDAPVWLSHYHGFQQKMDRDIRYLNTLGGSMQHAMTYFIHLRDASVLRYFPYTLAVISQIKKERQLKKDSDNLKLKSEESFTKLQLPEDVENEIIYTYQTSLLDLLGEAKVRGIDFVGYLQPILLKKYHPVSYEFKQAGINAVFRDATCQALWLGFQEQMGGFYLVGVEGLFSKTETLYQNLMSLYPNNFGNLIYLFKDVNDPIYSDVSHYKKEGSELIAHAVIKDLIQKNYLSVRKS